MLVGMDFNSYSDTVGATGNKTPQDATLTEMMAFKHIKWHNVVESNAINPSASLVTIKGRYFPGMAARNVSNDGDVKTWVKVAEQPTLKEFLTLYFYRAPMNYQNSRS